MTPFKHFPTHYLNDIGQFSSFILGLPLFDYQLQPLYPIIDSIRHQHGREYLLLFSRQSGKNEAMAHLLVVDEMQNQQRAHDDLEDSGTSTAG